MPPPHQDVLDGSEPQRGVSYTIGLDIGLKADRTVATVCHVEEIDADHLFPRNKSAPHDEDLSATDISEDLPARSKSESRRVVLDRIAIWQGSRQDPVKLSEVEAWLHHASKTYNNASITFDPWQAAGTMQRLRAENVRVIEFTFSSASVGKLAVGLHNALRNRQLALPRDDDLLDELANVRIRETSPNVYRLDHDEGQHDDRAISLALCVQALLHKPAMNFQAAMPLEVLPDVSGGWLAEIGGGGWRDEPKLT